MTIFDWYTAGIWHDGICIMTFFCCGYFMSKLSWESLKSRLLKIKQHQHQCATCPENFKKASKSAKLLGIKVLMNMLCPFLCDVLHLPQRVQICNKKMKNAIFSLGRCLVRPTYKKLQKSMLQHMKNVGKNLQHLADITTCPRHVYAFPN